MTKPVESWILALSVLMLGTFNSAYALTSSGADGALFVDHEVTIHLTTDNQIFNFTTVDITGTGILNFVGLNANQTFTMLASGDINFNFGSQVNVSSNAIFETAGSFNLQGNLYNSSSSSSLTLKAGTNLNGGAVTINHNNGEILANNPVTLDNGTISITTGGFDSAVLNRQDNLSSDASGSVFIIEDSPSSVAKNWTFDYFSSVFTHDYFSSVFTEVEIDRNMPNYFGDISITSPTTSNDENFGLIDLTELLGQSSYKQPSYFQHYITPHPQQDFIEGGQLYLLLDQDGNIISSVPEPSSFALLLAGISLFMLRRNTFSN